VARFLSEAWFREVAAAGAPADREPVLVLQQVVTGTPDGEVRYHVAVGEGRAVVVGGQAARADATFTQSYDTASAVARGELASQAALLAGRISVAGDMTSLSERRDCLAGVDALPRAVRAATTY
jgi:putative sterol carrier protein